MNFGAALANSEQEQEVVEAVYEETQEVIEGSAGLSLEQVKPGIIQIARRLDALLAEAKALEVTDEESLKTAVSLGGELAIIDKGIETKRKVGVEDHNFIVKTINGFCKMFTDKTAEGKDLLKRKIGQHQAKIELERREAERKVKEAAAELQRRLDAEAAEANRKAAEEARKRVEEEQRIKKEKDEEEAKARGAQEAELLVLAEKAEQGRLAALKLAEEEAAKNAVIAPTVIAPVIEEEKKMVRTESGSSSYQARAWKGTIIDADLVPIAYLSPDQRKINDAIKAGVRTIPGVAIVEETTTKFRA